MPGHKSVTLTVRFHPAVKAGLRLAAEQEHRSIANMLEVMIREYCDKKGIELNERTPASTAQTGQEVPQRSGREA